MLDSTLTTLIESCTHQAWPQLPDGPRWIKAQVMQESGGNPGIVSNVGAMGLLQLMPGTAKELGVRNPFDPIENLTGGVRYLRQQYQQLDEVPDALHRLLWSFASYNGGRGFIDFNGEPINTALELAKNHGTTLGVKEWWHWEFGKHDISRVVFRGLKPDWKQIVGYVDHILWNYLDLGGELPFALKASLPPRVH